MRRLILVVASLNLIATASDAIADDHFFPQRPQGAVIRTVSGVLTGYGQGMGGGSVIIGSGSSSKAFYMGYPMKINGVEVVCSLPPQRGKSGFNCDDWPAGLVLGRTVVTVSYWDAPLNGTMVEATDEIDFHVRRIGGPTPRPLLQPQPQPTQ